MLSPFLSLFALYLTTTETRAIITKLTRRVTLDRPQTSKIMQNIFYIDITTSSHLWHHVAHTHTWPLQGETLFEWQTYMLVPYLDLREIQVNTTVSVCAMKCCRYTISVVQSVPFCLNLQECIYIQYCLIDKI